MRRIGLAVLIATMPAAAAACDRDGFAHRFNPFARMTADADMLPDYPLGKYSPEPVVQQAAGREPTPAGPPLQRAANAEPAPTEPVAQQTDSARQPGVAEIDTPVPAEREKAA